MASAHLHRTLGTPTNEKKWTYSAWIKRSQYTAGHGQFLIACFTDASNRGRVYIEDGANSQLEVADRVGGSFDLQKKTNAMLRDESAWYHIVVGHDRTIATPVTNMYINGVLQTSFAGDNTVSQNAATSWNKSGSTMLIGKYGGGAQYFSGSMAHVHFCDGYLYAASDFGQTNTSTGIWTPKTSPSVTYGNNGFFLKFDNSGNMGLDSSGESNNFTTSGTIIQPKDTPSNVYATWNALIYNKSTFTNINTTSASGSSGELNATSTLGMAGGKWYMEFKRVSGNYPIFGIIDNLGMSTHTSETSVGLGKTGTTKSIALRLNDGKTRVNNVVTTQGGAISNGDIVGVAVDQSTNKIYFSKNGQWSNGSGAWDSTTFNAAVGATDVSSILTGDIWFFACGTDTGEANNTFSANFGNGYFGTTAITSAGSNGNGSLFEYDVPSGFYALNTKNLGTQS